MAEEHVWKDPKGIPFDDVLDAIRKMPYASTERVMFLMLALTGCRVAELDSMRMNNIHGSIVRWKIGKNQKGWRKEDVGMDFVHELREYRKTHRVPSQNLFGVNHHTFRRYFNVKVRPRLGEKWLEKIPSESAGHIKMVHRYAIKGLRKNFGTLDFKKNLDRYKDAYVSMLMTSQRFHHSSMRMTAFHYLQEFGALNIEEYADKTMAEVVATDLAQTRLMDFV